MIKCIVSLERNLCWIWAINDAFHIHSFNELEENPESILHKTVLAAIHITSYDFFFDGNVSTFLHFRKEKFSEIFLGYHQFILFANLRTPLI